MKYELIIFDADETLFDFKKSEKVALESTMRDFHVEYDEILHLEIYKEINAVVWKELEKGLITQRELNDLRFQRLFERLDIESNGSMIKITVSIGVKTVYSYEGNLSADSIINGADRALYHAKNNGRNQVSADESTV